jgi:hypothetical protein
MMKHFLRRLFFWDMPADSEIRDFNMPIGGLTWKQELLFDPSGNKAVMADCHIVQEPKV